MSETSCDKSKYSLSFSCECLWLIEILLQRQVDLALMLCNFTTSEVTLSNAKKWQHLYCWQMCVAPSPNTHMEKKIKKSFLSVSLEQSSGRGFTTTQLQITSVRLLRNDTLLTRYLGFTAGFLLCSLGGQLQSWLLPD